MDTEVNIGMTMVKVGTRAPIRSHTRYFLQTTLYLSVFYLKVYFGPHLCIGVNRQDLSSNPPPLLLPLLYLLEIWELVSQER